MALKSYAPKQARSRETLDCLLRATVQVLDEHGLENATIPRIAEVAGLAPASVYRRFEDKDALIRAALLSVLQASSVAVKEVFQPDRFADKTLEAAARRVIDGIFKQNRRHPRLVTALKRFSEREGEKEFEAAATQITAENFQTLVTALAACKDLADLKDRDAKLLFALLTVSTAIEIMTLEPTSLWNVLLTESDEEVQAKLTKMLMAYLTI